MLGANKCFNQWQLDTFSETFFFFLLQFLCCPERAAQRLLLWVAQDLHQASKWCFPFSSDFHVLVVRAASTLGSSPVCASNTSFPACFQSSSQQWHQCQRRPFPVNADGEAFTHWGFGFVNKANLSPLPFRCLTLMLPSHQRVRQRLWIRPVSTRTVTIRPSAASRSILWHSQRCSQNNCSPVGTFSVCTLNY